MAHLLLGPLLRHVDGTSATVWVEADAPCEVRVLDAAARTVAVHGHHFALVDVEGLEPGSETRYDVRLDGELAWPAPGDELPPPRIRTIDPETTLRVGFGSCRQNAGHDADAVRRWGRDALRTLAQRLLTGEAEPPALLFLCGDQVYADEPTEEMLEVIRARRSLDEPPGHELKDFEEYAHLYRVSWDDPLIRWLLSTVPSAMIFDDHDVRDDWNTSQTWRERMDQVSWWRSRIVGALASYWVYQHLGNLHPHTRAEDPTWQALLAHDGDAGELVDAFAGRAHDEPDSTRWSYVRELGRSRLVVADSRASRRLTPGRRRMLDDAEWSWLLEQLRGDVDHLLVGSSLPVLLPPAVHDLQRWNEEVADGAWGHRAARVLGERVREAADLEHWAAFGDSFAELMAATAAVSRGERGRPPASITFLSGDVHFSYLARVAAPGASAVAQAVCSPVRNPLGPSLRAGQRLLQTRALRAAMRRLARAAGAGPPALRWEVTDGPWFDNAIATITFDGHHGAIAWETPTGDARLEALGGAALTGPPRDRGRPPAPGGAPGR